MTDSTEKEDFAAVLTENGFKIDDFDVKSIDRTPYPPDGSPTIILEETVVIRTSNGKSCVYDSSGTGTHWVVDFKEDLLAGKYS